MVLAMVLCLLSTIGLLYLYEKYKKKRMCKVLCNVPGPTTYPLVGSAFAFGTNSVELMENVQKLSTDFGPVVQVWLGPTLYVILSDSKDIEVVLSSTIHLNKPQVYDFLKKWLGTGLISAPASKWKTQRKILTPAFHFKILESYVDVFNANTTIMMDLLEKEEGKEKFNIMPFVDNCTLDIICETAMTTNINAQLNDQSEFTKSLKIVSNAVLVRAFKPWLFPDLIFNLSQTGQQYNKHLAYINSYVDKVIHEKTARLTKASETKYCETNFTPEDNFYGTKRRLVFLDLLLMYATDPSIHLSEADIRDEVNTFIFAGHDTTASTVGFAIYLLASNLDIQAKVVEELQNVFGNSDRNPTYQELLSLKYLERVIKETLRLYPAVPIIARKLYEDLKLPSGYTMPAGAALSLNIFQAHRDPQVFPDPEKFNPDNFLPERMTGRFAFAYTPFSAGPRNCIGQKFAMLEMKAVLSRLLRTYRVTAAPPEPVLASELILRSQTGVNVQLSKLSFS